MKWWEPMPDLTRFSQELRGYGEVVRWPLYRYKGDGDMPEYEELKPTPKEGDDRPLEPRTERPWAPNYPLEMPETIERRRLEWRAQQAERRTEEAARRFRLFQYVIRGVWVGVILLAFGSLMLPTMCDTVPHVLDDPDHYSRRGEPLWR